MSCPKLTRNVLVTKIIHGKFPQKLVRKYSGTNFRSSANSTEPKNVPLRPAIRKI